MHAKFAIEFSQGTYFRSLDDEHGVPKHLAALFCTVDAAEAVLRQHAWIRANGGVVVQITRSEERAFEERAFLFGGNP